MVTEFGPDLNALALDMTNFASFINSSNDRAPIAQRDHAKHKRNDLRLVGLGLVVTRDGAIPIASHPYAGDRLDVTQFTTVLDQLTTRYQALLGTTDNPDIAQGGAAGPAGEHPMPTGPTVVFNAGQNSKANFTHLASTGLHFIRSLPPQPLSGSARPASQ